MRATIFRPTARTGPCDRLRRSPARVACVLAVLVCWAVPRPLVLAADPPVDVSAAEDEKVRQLLEKGQAADGPPPITNAPGLKVPALPAAEVEPGQDPANPPVPQPGQPPVPGVTAPTRPPRRTPPPLPSLPQLTPARPAGAGTRNLGAPAGAPAGAAAQPTPDAAGAVATDEQSPEGARKRALDDEGGRDIIPAGTIKFQEADLYQVLDFYQELTGKTVLRPATLTGGKITIKTQTPLTRKEAIQALDTIFSLNKITLVPQGELFMKAVPDAQAPQTGLVFYGAGVDELPEAGQYIAYVAKIEYADPEELGKTLEKFSSGIKDSILIVKSTQTIVLRDYSENVKRMVEVIKKIDIYVPQDYKPVVIPIKYALAGDIASVLGSLAGGGGGMTVGGSGAAGGLSGGRAGAAGGLGGQQGGMQGQQGYGQQQGALGGRNTGARGRSGAAGGTRGSFQNRLQNVANRAAGQGEIVVLGQTKIIADERINAILVFANDEDIRIIKDVIDKLDIVLPQVMIEAIIMEVALDKGLNVGISYLQRPQTMGNWTTAGGVLNGDRFIDPGNFTGTNGTPVNVQDLISGFSYFGKLGDEFNIAVRAIATDNRVNVLSRPIIQTSHAVEANLFVGETRPYVTGTYYSGGAGIGNSSQYSQLQIGLTLSVLPLINPDGLVVMDIMQKIQSVSGFVTIDNNQLPVTIDREAEAKVAVKDKETVMLGGFISAGGTRNSSGVPWLKDLPVLGFLFRSSRKDTDRRELIVLIRPTVLPTPQDASVAAAEHKRNLPGVRLAEAEVNADQEVRMEAAEQVIKEREEKAAKDKKKLKRGRVPLERAYEPPMP